MKDYERKNQVRNAYDKKAPHLLLHGSAGGAKPRGETNTAPIPMVPQTPPENNDFRSEYLTIPEAVRYMRSCRSKVYELLQTGRLRGTKIGAKWLIRLSDIEAYLNQFTNRVKIGRQDRA
ncbi:MAG: helix-turn-helix domain-containing protein [Treponema sp.]|jgi:excisionase family DNA binding protein|nr:helix-turn-helix domain-containing protein [Treponema sp.]